MNSFTYQKNIFPKFHTPLLMFVRLLTAECDEEFEFPFLEKSLARIQEVMR
jgi:hypothetical protein